MFWRPYCDRDSVLPLRVAMGEKVMEDELIKALNSLATAFRNHDEEKIEYWKKRVDEIRRKVPHEKEIQ